MTTVIVDYDSGNLHSAEKAFQKMALETASGPVMVTADPDVIRRADRIVLPVDGAFPACRHALFDHRGVFEAMEEAVARDAKPFLGICLGLQLLFTESEEFGMHKGLDIIPGKVRRFPADPALKVPHMGWNTVDSNSASVLFKGVEAESFYFVHSYAAKNAVGKTQAWSTHGERFLAAVEDGYISATQFHPEKSGAAGLALIKNWVGSL